MKKPCREDEIRNPKTDRCVKRTGKIGRELVKKEPTIITKTYRIYIPSYLRQQQEKSWKPRTLKAYVKEEHPSVPTTLVSRFILHLAQDVLGTTKDCVQYYRNSTKVRRVEVEHTLKMFGISTDAKKEDKEFTAILKDEFPDPDMESSAYRLLSCVLLPFTSQAPTDTFVEKIKSLRPLSRLQHLYLRYML